MLGCSIELLLRRSPHACVPAVLLRADSKWINSAIMLIMLSCDMKKLHSAVTSNYPIIGFVLLCSASALLSVPHLGFIIVFTVCVICSNEDLHYHENK